MTTLARETKRWVEEELSGLELGDERLNQRAKRLMERLGSKPTASLPLGGDGWGETVAAYRFLGNQAVSWEGILKPHWKQTQKRMSRHGVVLCLQDTTELDFNGQETAGLGPLNYEARRGMYVHPTYAVTVEREPLGVLDAWMWAREDRDESGARPAGIKESTRWIEGYERVAEMAVELPETRLVYVADREADLVALMQRAEELGTPADWLVRAKHNRCLPDGQTLWAHTTQGDALGEISFMLPARGGSQKARKVRQQLWACRVEIPSGKTEIVSATCIVAREIGAPKGVKPVEWRLLTNRVAPTLAEVTELIDWYRARWEIEIYFNVLKNGCTVEALQLSGIDRLERALALYLIVAWRIAHLMRAGRTCPDLDAALFFDPDEIRGAYILTKKPRPKEPPRLNQILRLIAELGGFLGRKSDGQPGVKTIWLGLQRIMDAVTTLHAIREEFA